MIERQVGIIGIRVLGTAEVPVDQVNGEIDLVRLKCPNTYEVGTNAINAECNKAPVKKIEVPITVPASLPSRVKHELDPKIQNSVDRLERLKRERAAMEVRVFELYGRHIAFLFPYAQLAYPSFYFPRISIWQQKSKNHLEMYMPC